MLVLSVFSSGCEKFKKKQPSPPPQQLQKPDTRQQQPQQSKPIQAQRSSVRVTPAPVNQYDFSTKKDPFKPFLAVKVESPAEKFENARKAKKDALPIHSFDVSQFKLAGVVADARGNKAMLMDPSGKAYVVKIGMTIGKSEAKISKITTAGLEAIEEFRDENGKTRKETIKIPMLRKP